MVIRPLAGPGAVTGSVRIGAGTSLPLTPAARRSWRHDTTSPHRHRRPGVLPRPPALAADRQPRHRRRRQPPGGPRPRPRATWSSGSCTRSPAATAPSTRSPGTSATSKACARRRPARPRSARPRTTRSPPPTCSSCSPSTASASWRSAASAPSSAARRPRGVGSDLGYRGDVRGGRDRDQPDPAPGRAAGPDRPRSCWPTRARCRPRRSSSAPSSRCPAASPPSRRSTRWSARRAGGGPARLTGL